MIRTGLLRVLGAGVLSLCITTAAFADEDDSWMSQRWGMGQMMGGWGMMGGGPEAMLDRIDGRLAFMKTELKITEAQSADWEALAKVIRSTAEAHNSLMQTMMNDMRSGDIGKMPLPDRLALQETHLSARLNQVREIKAAVDKLYASLSEEQKKAADDIVLPMMGMGMGRGMMMR
jgi:hypothetical protein